MQKKILENKTKVLCMFLVKKCCCEKSVSIVVRTAPTNTKRIAILFQQNPTAVGDG